MGLEEGLFCLAKIRFYVIGWDFIHYGKTLFMNHEIALDDR
jgi:hypothetical protein